MSPDIDHLNPDSRALTSHDRLTRIAFCQAEIQLVLSPVHIAASGLHQHRQFSVRVRRTEVLDHLVPPAGTLGDLDCSRTRTSPDLAQKHHDTARYPPD